MAWLLVVSMCNRWRWSMLCSIPPPELLVNLTVAPSVEYYLKLDPYRELRQKMVQLLGHLMIPVSSLWWILFLNQKNLKDTHSKFLSVEIAPSGVCYQSKLKKIVKLQTNKLLNILCTMKQSFEIKSNSKHWNWGKLQIYFKFFIFFQCLVFPSWGQYIKL